MEKRKLQLIGGSSYMISLPKNWVKKHNLNQGDELILQVNDNYLKIFPNKRTSELFRISIRLPKMDYDFLKKLIYSLYIQGVDEIIIENPKYQQDLSTKLSEIVRNMVGMEIIDVNESRIVLRCLTTSFNVSDVLKRLCQIICDMFDTIESNFRRKNLDFIDIISNLEKDADRFYLLAVRLNYKSIRENVCPLKWAEVTHVLESRTIAKMLEEIADSLYDISTEFSLNGEMLTLLLDLRRLFRIATDTYFNGDTIMSKNLIDMASELEEEILRLKERAYCEIGSLLEICRYIKSIGEMVFNEAVGREYI
jgi:phosphate uptake regulator